MPSHWSPPSLLGKEQPRQSLRLELRLATPFLPLVPVQPLKIFLKALENDDGKLLKALLKRLEPFSSGLAGSALHIANERKQLFAMMGSRLLNSDGFVAVFGTYAPCDRFNPVRQLFKNKH